MHQVIFLTALQKQIKQRYNRPRIQVLWRSLIFDLQAKTGHIIARWLEQLRFLFLVQHSFS